MKQILTKVFWPILSIFEKGNENYSYKPLSRKILILISLLFLLLAGLVAYFYRDNDDPGYLLPIIIFSAIAFTGLIVGLLGSDRAVAKIWGSR